MLVYEKSLTVSSRNRKTTPCRIGIQMERTVLTLRRFPLFRAAIKSSKETKPSAYGKKFKKKFKIFEIYRY